ncbi:hypothetical protein V8F33_005601 [Rhypophila sp. PSN 637]
MASWLPFLFRSLVLLALSSFHFFKLSKALLPNYLFIFHRSYRRPSYYMSLEVLGGKGLDVWRYILACSCIMFNSRTDLQGNNT